MLSPYLEYDSRETIEIFDEIGVGKRLVIIAESEKGPLYEPTPVLSKNFAVKEFGDGPLLERYEEARRLEPAIQVIFLRIENKDFKKALDSIFHYDFDLVYIDEFSVLHDDINIFINFCKEKEETGSLVHGFFDLELDFDQEKLQELLKSLSFQDILDTYEDGKYFSLVLDQLEDCKAGIVYAALVSTLDPGISPVNKRIPYDLKKTYKKHELIKLNDLGVVVFRESFHYDVVCSNSTCAVVNPDSAHKRIENFRIAQQMIQELSEEFRKHIGMPFNIGDGIVNKIKDIIDDKIDNFIDLNRIRGAQYSVLSNQVSGSIFVNMEIVPIFSLNYIRAYAQVRVYR